MWADLIDSLSWDGQRRKERRLLESMTKARLEAEMRRCPYWDVAICGTLMRQSPQGALFLERLDNGTLEAAQVRALAGDLAKAESALGHCWNPDFLRPGNQPLLGETASGRWLMALAREWARRP